jgi:hypothetical protein
MDGNADTNEWYNRDIDKIFKRENTPVSEQAELRKQILSELL